MHVHFLLSFHIVPAAQQRPVVIIIPGVGGIAATDITIAAGGALCAILGPVPPENFKVPEPDVHKTILANISLNQFRAIFDIEAGTDVAVAANPGDEYTRSAHKTEIAHFALIFCTKKM